MMRVLLFTTFLFATPAVWMAAQQPAPIEEPAIAQAGPRQAHDLPPPPGQMLKLPPLSAEDAEPVADQSKMSKQQVIRSVLGFVVLLVLAYVAGHEKLAAIEQRLHVGPTLTTGFVFVLLGLLAATGAVAVLTNAVVKAIAPIVPFCLGWFGFRAGFSYDRELLSNPPAGTGVLLSVLLPLLLSVGGSAALVAWVNPDLLSQPSIWRDLCVLGLACGISSLPAARHIEQRWAGRIQMGRLVGFVKMEHLAGVVGLMLLSVYERPQGAAVAWQMPLSAWIFVSVGLGALMGLLAWALFKNAPDGPPFIVVLLGSVALCAGMASFLRLAVLPVCFIAGLIVADLPGASKDQVRAVLEKMQRAVMLVLLVVAGALWQPAAWQGWALLGVYLAARLAGNRLSMAMIGRWMNQELSPDERRALGHTPTGAFALAVVLSARDLYPDSKVPYILTAAIMGAVLGEMLLRTYAWKPAQTAEEATR